MRCLKIVVGYFAATNSSMIIEVIIQLDYIPNCKVFSVIVSSGADNAGNVLSFFHSNKLIPRPHL